VSTRFSAHFLRSPLTGVECKRRWRQQDSDVCEPVAPGGARSRESVLVEVRQQGELLPDRHRQKERQDLTGRWKSDQYIRGTDSATGGNWLHR